MPLIGHLRELRNRLLKAALALVLVMVLGFVFFDQIWSFVSHPFCSAVINGKTGCRRTGDQLVVSTGCSTRSCCGSRSRSSSG